MFIQNIFFSALDICWWKYLWWNTTQLKWMNNDLIIPVALRLLLIEIVLYIDCQLIHDGAPALFLHQLPQQIVQMRHQWHGHLVSSRTEFHRVHLVRGMVRYQLQRSPTANWHQKTKSYSHDKLWNCHFMFVDVINTYDLFWCAQIWQSAHPYYNFSTFG